MEQMTTIGHVPFVLIVADVDIGKRNFRHILETNATGHIIIHGDTGDSHKQNTNMMTQD